MASIIRSTAQFALPRAMQAVEYSTREYRQHWPEIAGGLAVGVRGGVSAFKRGTLARHFRAFGTEYAMYALGMYAVALGIGFTVLAPISLLLLFVWPSGLLQLALLLPHWAYSIAREQNPQAFEDAFVDELRALDPDYAQQYIEARDSSGRTGQWGQVRRVKKRGLLSRLASSGSFTLSSLKYSLIGFVPILGPLQTFAGQGTLLARSLASDLLEPWMDSMGWSTDRKQAFLDSNKWTLTGFALPYAILGIVPLVGGAATAVAQAAAAHMVHELLAPPSGSSHTPTLTTAKESMGAAMDDARLWLTTWWQRTLRQGPGVVTWIIGTLRRVAITGLDLAGLPQDHPVRKALDAATTGADLQDWLGGSTGKDKGKAAPGEAGRDTGQWYAQQVRQTTTERSSASWQGTSTGSSGDLAGQGPTAPPTSPKAQQAQASISTGGVTKLD